MAGKRIALAIDSLSGGGAEKVVLVLAKALQQRGDEVHIITLSPICDYATDSSIPIHTCFSENVSQFDSFFKLKRKTAQFKRWLAQLQQQVGQFDLYISNLDRTNQLFISAGISPLYCVVHNSVEQELKRAMKLGPFAYLCMLKAKKALDGQQLITVSKGVEQEIIQAQRIKPKSIITIYNPFDFGDIKQLAAAPNRLIPQGDYMLHIGRVAKQKRHDILFKAIALMKNPIPLVLLCNNVKKVKKLAEKYGVADRIITPGFQTNPYPWIKQAKLLVLSSDYEGLPTVIIESLICQTAVVSTDCPHGPNEILTGKLAKYLCDMGSPHQLAERLDLAMQEKDYFDTESTILRQVTAAEVAERYSALI